MARLDLHPLQSPIRIDEYGVARVGRTRVILDLVIDAYQRGKTPEAIIISYPALRLADVYATIAYYLDHREAIDMYLCDREAEAEALQQANDDRSNPPGFRDRLLARQSAMLAGPHDAAPR